ncbi:GNAT family N-acetyltransferase [Gloeobacter violaceus]|uniref:Gll3034 protein n=1 Tax=Gloeobacter violaceus (strain ATCC 29082 / PCC 7421) TaxID=251221 RepID=Q7NCE5_GLOVI|nr:GNAT family N-acetyltransferase [Gloeobacter violaceus]BAC90975.1 gll3034 [Gloeobacter violaceus PCC 7421]
MLPVIDTARLQLRPLVLADEDELCALWSDPEVVRYTSETPLAREVVQEMTRRWVQYNQHSGHGAWAIAVRESGAFAGYCFLRFLQETPDTELGYGLGKPFWGRGYMSETVRAVLDYGLGMGLTRIVAAAMPENVASWRVMERCGMRYEGIKEYKASSGKCYMDKYYAIESSFAAIGQTQP